ncbi:mannose-6-phosphate isomerase, class I [uncultured Polaribacter sp.]|uniref:mannose-6-phosphate isomerase, class I n=1 Tax=uncultured Polaribacter sp. TaxID=174711 RepID=UPI002632ACB2|nr:mannose-6-phosphate isomerase, class I [uncultured Polaribacter sp.]
MNKFYKIKGEIQNYEWGGKSFIPNLISENINKNYSYAEYWLGAHLKAPSKVFTEKGIISLDLFLNENPKETLGKQVAKNFGKLPYLFKVLDVREMLSIQVHPSKEAARIGYKNENKKGIPLNASNRNYKDENHKPEIMVALTEFWLLHGFLDLIRLTRNIKETPELSFLLPIFLEDGYTGLYKKVMEYSQDEVNEVLKPLVERILPKYLNNELEKSSPEFWAAKSLVNKESKNIDKGIFSIYFFNILKLSRGEAIFQDAGVPHAYLEGVNMELMANSDNVLRAGLTNKHIDVSELIKNTKFESTIPDILKGVRNIENGEVIYKTLAKDFELSKIELSESIVHRSISNSLEILILIKGTATCTQGNETMSLEKGQAILVKADTAYKIETNSEVEIYKASVPK